MKILLNNNDFIEQQNKDFQRSIYWNEYKTKNKLWIQIIIMLILLGILV